MKGLQCIKFAEIDRLMCPAELDKSKPLSGKIPPIKTIGR